MPAAARRSRTRRAARRRKPAAPPAFAVGIIGAGRAGLGLALALRRARVRVAGVHGRREKPVPAGVRLTTGAAPPWLRSAGVLILAVRDDALAPLVADLVRGGVGQGQVVLHLSGALTAAVLAPLSDAGAAAGSMHPLMTVSHKPAEAARHFHGASFVLEGSLEAVAAADALVRRLGGVPLTLAPEAKPLYHAGAVCASNYLVTLFAEAVRLLEQAGIGGEAARAALLPLARATLENVATAGPAGALTGPIARGDVQTLRRHLAALPHADAELYRTVGRATLRLAREAGLQEALAARVEEVLRVR